MNLKEHSEMSGKDRYHLLYQIELERLDLTR